MSITPSIAAFWDAAAGSFDEAADHGLHDPRVRDAWAARLASWLPAPPADVLDLGCGTGSLALLMARHGHRVTGVDHFTTMAEHAHRKLSAAGLDAHVLVGDAADPPPLGHGVDVILARHLLWTLPDPATALQRWIALSRPDGRLVLIEGRWNAGQDNTYVEGSQSLPWTGGRPGPRQHPAATCHRPPHEPLTDPSLWGRTINDERYAIIATI
jgi:SAM-dependent methyltransferase